VMSLVRIGEPFVKEALLMWCCEGKTSMAVILSCRSMEGEEDVVLLHVIAEGSNVKGRMDCWVQL